MGYGDLSRKEIIDALTKRDGYQCYFPDCDAVFSNKNLPTIDHYFPQEYCRKNGWSEERTHDLSNLKIACRYHNVTKNNIVPNADGTVDLPPRRVYVQKQPRAVVCDLCYSGRTLLMDEICYVCGSGPQPKTAPRYLQVEPSVCSHDDTYCRYCFIGWINRVSPLEELVN